MKTIERYKQVDAQQFAGMLPPLTQKRVNIRVKISGGKCKIWPVPAERSN